MAVTVGPVQDFIAAARRTRDLWFGSRILSDISRAVAHCVEEAEGRLIFPYSTTVSNVANVILAEITISDPAALSNKAKIAALAEWRRQASEVLHDPAIANFVDHTRWEAQVDDVVEFYAAWVPLESPKAYKVQRQRLMRLLAGRKACRDFTPSPESKMRIRKSSLDGARETVLCPRTGPDPLGRCLRLNAGEQLDVVGLTKRHGAGVQNYPSVARIAADPWLFGLGQQFPDVADRLCTGFRQLKSAGVVTDAHWPQFAHFPFDAAPVYLERHKELREQAPDPAVARGLLHALDLRAIYRQAGEPSPYLAVICADGDGMGRLISNAESAQEHRNISERLSGFAELAKAIVDRQHYGKLVYAGGDDVLAFVPVDMALRCANALRRAFRSALLGLDGRDGEATLSVGIGIGHFMEPLEDLLAYARNAEKAAKAKGTALAGNGLAIHFHTRGGEPSMVRDQWSSGILERLELLTDLFARDLLAEKAGYDLETVARKYENLTFEADEANWLARALPAEAAFVLGRKQGAHHLAAFQLILQTATSASALRGLAREMIIATRLAAAQRQSGGRSTVLEPIEASAADGGDV